MSTAILDFVGVTLIGLAGTLSFAMVAEESPPPFIAQLATAIGLGELSDARLLTALAAAAAILLIAKSIVAPLLMARVFRFLARREAIVSARLTKELLARPLSFVQLRSTQETARALLRGTHAAIGIVLGQAAAALSELALLTVFAISLLLINPAVALGAIAFFGVITWGVQRALGSRAARLGSQSAGVDDLLSLRTIQEALGAYREITVTGRRSFYVEHLRNLRDRSASSAVSSQIVSVLPKYVFEAGLVLGAFMLAVVLFTTQPVAVAAGTLAVFLAAATRVVPALLRVQSAALSIRAASGPAEPTFALAEDLGHPLDTSAVEAASTWLSRDGYPDFVPSVDVRDVTYAYAGAGVPALREVNLTVSAGQTVALVGRSGAGKSTLADVILGVLQPDAGKVLVGGIEPSDAIRRWPGAVAYVPQQIMLVEASVRANVALGLPEHLIDDEHVWAAIGRTQLADFVRTKSDGLDTQIGERGLRLSGGQRQRLGIARALYSRPRLLILDEATSALDAETEQAITSILNDLGQSVTVVVIAHRLSTVRHADLVVYLEDGSVVAAGSFAEVCARVPAFRRQAELMGLRPA
jgi:ABC-type multidrug transport system fused ATPase/permease subunit